jgi:hypothetical protein
MGALMASAVKGPNGWEPNFRSVAKALEGVTPRTLARWWAARDAAQDAALRRVHCITQDKAQAEGSQTYEKSISEWLAQRTEELLSDDEAWQKAHLDARARTLKIVGDLGRKEDNRTGQSRASRLERFNKAAKRTAAAQAGDVLPFKTKAK